MPLSSSASSRAHKVLTQQLQLLLWIFCLGVALLLNFALFFPSTSSSTTSTRSSSMRIIVTAPTFYATTDDIRFELALELCRQAAHHQLELILIDASPNSDIGLQFQQAGRRGSNGIDYVRVVRQTGPGKKGAALRLGIAEARRMLNNDRGIIAFQEPEKVGMMQHWKSIAEQLEHQADICVPKRSESSFFQSYPTEQYHSEQFANLYLNSLAERVGFPSDIDWTMGPIAFRSSWAHHWLDYTTGELWDAQIVPMVRAQRREGAKVVSYEFDYRQPPAMKQQEEGDPRWSEKRLVQLNHLFEYVGGALKEEI